MEIKSNTELDNGHLRDTNFKAEKDGMDLVFSVTVDIDYKVYRPDYDSPPEYEVKHRYIYAILKEVWSGGEKIRLHAKEEVKLEEELEKQLEKLYHD
jgi:hypothetical protein